MNNKEFSEKSSGIFEKFKVAVRESSAAGTAAMIGLFSAGSVIVMHGGVEAFYREQQGRLTGVVPPISPDTMAFDLTALAAGAGIAGATYGAVLLAKWMVSVGDKLEELERIKFERGESPENPANPKGLRGAVRLSEKEQVNRSAIVQDEKTELSPLDAFYESHGYSDRVGASADSKSQNTPRMN